MMRGRSVLSCARNAKHNCEAHHHRSARPSLLPGRHAWLQSRWIPSSSRSHLVPRPASSSPSHGADLPPAPDQGIVEGAAGPQGDKELQDSAPAGHPHQHTTSATTSDQHAAMKRMQLVSTAAEQAAKQARHAADTALHAAEQARHAAEPMIHDLMHQTEHAAKNAADAALHAAEVARHTAEVAAHDLEVAFIVPLEDLPPEAQRHNIREALRDIHSQVRLFVGWGAISMACLWVWAAGMPLRRSNPYTFTVTFPNAEGVHPGVPVRLKGVPVGAVKSVSVDLHQVYTEVEIYVGDTRIPKHGSLFEYNKTGMMNPEAFIDITTAPIRPSGPPLQPAGNNQPQMAGHATPAGISDAAAAPVQAGQQEGVSAAEKLAAGQGLQAAMLVSTDDRGAYPVEGDKGRLHALMHQAVLDARQAQQAKEREKLAAAAGAGAQVAGGAGTEAGTVSRTGPEGEAAVTARADAGKGPGVEVGSDGQERPLALDQGPGTLDTEHQHAASDLQEDRIKAAHAAAVLRDGDRKDPVGQGSDRTLDGQGPSDQQASAFPQRTSPADADPAVSALVARAEALDAMMTSFSRAVQQTGGARAGGGARKFYGAALPTAAEAAGMTEEQLRQCAPPGQVEKCKEQDLLVRAGDVVAGRVGASADELTRRMVLGNRGKGQVQGLLGIHHF